MTCQAGRSHNTFPPVSWHSSWGLDAIICRTATVSLGFLCICHGFRHVALFGAVVASFGHPTFMPLYHFHCHNDTFGFPCNHCFVYRVLHLEGGCFNFLESQSLIWWDLTVDCCGLAHSNLNCWVGS